MKQLLFVLFLLNVSTTFAKPSSNACPKKWPVAAMVYKGRELFGGTYYAVDRLALRIDESLISNEKKTGNKFIDYGVMGRNATVSSDQLIGTFEGKGIKDAAIGTISESIDNGSEVCLKIEINKDLKLKEVTEESGELCPLFCNKRTWLIIRINAEENLTFGNGAL